MSEREISEIAKTSSVWTRMNQMAGIEVVNGSEGLPSTVVVGVIYCPLYAPGSLSESRLIKQPLGITDSRVANKVSTYLTTIKSLNESLKLEDKNLYLKAILSNKGVLFAHDDTSEVAHDLEYHKQILQETTQLFCLQEGIEYDFSDYQSLEVNFPVFVDPSASLPVETPDRANPKSAMIDCLNSYLDLPVPIENTKRNRNVIRGILGMDGISFESAFWLIAGYLAFDYKLADLLGENGVYLVAERFDPLFAISKLTQALDKKTRIQIKA